MIARAEWLRADQRRLGALLRALGYSMSVVSDAREARGLPRLSATPEGERFAVVEWLGTAEGGRAYAAAERYRTELIDCAATHDRAALVATAAALGEHRTRPSRWSARTIEAVIVAVRIAELTRPRAPRPPLVTTWLDEVAR